jgi:hypothetical protein
MSFWSWRDSASRAAAEVHGATTGGGGAGVEGRERQCWRRAEVEMAAAKAARRASAAAARWACGESGRVMRVMLETLGGDGKGRRAPDFREGVARDAG